MSKLVFVALLAVFAMANARGIIAEGNDTKNNDIVSLEKESRVLLEVPLIGKLIYKSFKVVWFLLTTFCSVVDFKLAALALAVNLALYLFSNCYPLIAGAVLMFGFCKVTGLCNKHYIYEKTDSLAYASDHLDLGTLKYGGL
ncbi:uncharacterized protein LOC114362648 [Ostrinia furnacalis]|uniref:uncharacterized protein LOC114362648 n=1 Tax=Ostrinia furnacalis TaxID=93504 RepID=UPI00103DB023|nr:uncharacterized protein LOC114362648 [Ostrinia furnacalis]